MRKDAKRKCIICDRIIFFPNIKYCGVKCSRIGQKRNYQNWLKEQPKQEYEYEDEFDSISYFDSINKFKKKQVQNLLEPIIQHNGICPRCNKKDTVSDHHIIPRDRNGGNNKENMIYLCFKCHDEVEILTDELLNIRSYSPSTLRSFIINDSFPINDRLLLFSKKIFTQIAHKTLSPVA